MRCGAVNSKKHWVILLVKHSVYAIVRGYVPCHESVHLNDIKIILCQRRNIKLKHMDLRACLPNKCCLIGYQLKQSKPTLATHNTTYVVMYTDSRDIW